MIYQIPVGTGFEMRRKMFPALVFLPVLWYAGIRQKTTGVDTMAEQERWNHQTPQVTTIQSASFSSQAFIRRTGIVRQAGFWFAPIRLRHIMRHKGRVVVADGAGGIEQHGP